MHDDQGEDGSISGAGVELGEGEWLLGGSDEEEAQQDPELDFQVEQYEGEDLGGKNK